MTGFRKISVPIFLVFFVSIVVFLTTALWLKNYALMEYGFLYTIGVSIIFFIYSITGRSDLEELERYLKLNKKNTSSSGPIELKNFYSIDDKFFTLIKNPGEEVVFVPNGTVKQFRELKYVKISTESSNNKKGYYLAVEEDKTFLIEVDYWSVLPNV